MTLEQAIRRYGHAFRNYLEGDDDREYRALRSQIIGLVWHESNGTLICRLLRTATEEISLR